MKNKKILWGLMLVPLLSGAQNYKYQSSHKEVELNYGVIENDKYDSILDSEKFKYSMTYTERTHVDMIDANNNYTFEVKLDSLSNEQTWMNLARKFTYDGSRKKSFFKDGSLASNNEYSEEQLNQDREFKQSIMDDGYHPGLTEFPVLPDSFPSEYSANGVTISKVSNGIFKVVNENMTTTYDNNLKVIIREFLGDDGNKIKDMTGYEYYQDNKGFLMSIYKRERYSQTYNGTCVTEVKLIYYTDYTINDPGNLIGKAMHETEELSISPNPNNGLFSAKVLLANGSNIQSVEIVNLMNNTIIQIPISTSPTFPVDISTYDTGQYVIRVITSNGVLTRHFIKY